MKKIVSLVCTMALLISAVCSVPLVTVSAASGTAGGKQTTYTGGSTSPTFRDLSAVDFTMFGDNLITDPTVGNFVDGVYPEYYNWSTKDTSAPVNPNAWWDRPAVKSTGFESDPLTNANTSARYSGYVCNDTSLSHTNDGSGVLKIVNSGTGYSMAQSLPLPSMVEYSYYVISLWIKSTAADAGKNLNIKSAAGKSDDTQDPSNGYICRILHNNITASGGHLNEWLHYTLIVYTGSSNWNQPVMTIPGGASGSSATHYIDDIGVYKIDNRYNYGSDSYADQELKPTTTSYFPPMADRWDAAQGIYSGNVFGTVAAGTFAWRDLSNVRFDTFGKNLITDPTVANFVDGDYPEYYSWSTKDTSAPVNPKAWWDRPALVWNGFSASPIENSYTSARYSDYIYNEPTASHTKDGSAVLKIGGTRKSKYLPLPSVERYSYYAVTFWFNASAVDWDGNQMAISSAPNGTVLAEVSDARLVQQKGVNQWFQCAFIIYTGKHAWGQPCITIPGTKNTTYYFDDFGMYKLNAEYGAACLEAGYFLDKTVSYGSNQGICLNMRSNQYVQEYEDVDWSDYGVNIFPDSTVSRFDEDGITYLNYDTNKLAILDKRPSSNEGTLYQSLNDRGFVTADTSYSHTDDGSGAVYIPANGANATQVYIALPTLEQYTFYAVAFWVRNPQREYTDINLRCIANATAFTSPGATFYTGHNVSAGNDYWQRVTFLLYTSNTNTYYLGMPYIQVNIKDVTIDEIEVWKLDDESFAAECMTAGRLVQDGDVNIRAHSLVLGSEIGINFFADLSSLTAEEKAASYMTFAVSKSDKSPEASYDADFTDLGGKGYSGFTCYLSSVQMAEKVTPTLHYGDGQTVTGTPYSVKDYIGTVVANSAAMPADLVTLVKALGDYGHYAQIYLGARNSWAEGTDYTALAKYRAADYGSDDYSTYLSALSGAAVDKTIDGTAVTGLSYNLNFDSNTYMNVELRATESVFASAAVNGETLYVSNSGKFRTPGLSILQLGAPVTITGVGSTNAAEFSITLSGLSYVRAILNSGTTSAAAKDAVSALYDYYRAACNYAGV